MTKGGGRRMIAWSNTTLIGKTGTVEYVIGTGIDVTERREAEAALRDSEQRYRGFVQNFQGIAFRASLRPLNFVPVFFHGAVKEITGYTSEEFVQGRMTWDRLIHPEDRPSFMRRIDDLVNRPDQEREREYRILRRDGQIRWIQEYVQNVCDETGEPVYVQGTAYDITDRKRMEEEIRDHAELLEKRVEERTERIRVLEKQRSEMEKLAATGRIVAGVAHEINNPLAGIKNSFLLIKDAVPRDHTYHEYVGLIEREIDRISAIVRQMYQLYRPESQKPAVTDIGKVLEETCRMLDQYTRDRRLRIEMDIAEDIPKISVPDGDVRQILYNLLLNAIQASAEGTDVTVALRREEDTLRIIVTDQGEGIPEDVLPHIFEPFFTTKEGGTQGGLGLGLAVSHSLAAAMGGRIEVDAVKGKGTSFTLHLPCRDPFTS
jgi:PAS domain S-box-containing protein